MIHFGKIVEQLHGGRIIARRDRALPAGEAPSPDSAIPQPLYQFPQMGLALNRPRRDMWDYIGIAALDQLDCHADTEVRTTLGWTHDVDDGVGRQDRTDDLDDVRRRYHLEASASQELLYAGLAASFPRRRIPIREVVHKPLCCPSDARSHRVSGRSTKGSACGPICCD